MNPAADVQIEPAHTGRLARARRLPGVRAFGARVPLVARIALASALLAVLVAAAFTILVLTLSDLRVTTSQANRSKDVTSATLVLEKDVLQVDAALRGYVNTGDRRFLRAFRDARAELPASTAALEQQRRRQGRAGAAGTQARHRGRPVHGRTTRCCSIGIAELNAAVATVARGGHRGPQEIEGIRRQVTQVLTAENDLASARVSSATSQANRAIVLGLAALGISVLLVLLFGVELARAVAHPVRRVSEASKQVAGGDLSVRLPEQGPAEVHDLAASFNEMAASLERSKHELEEQNRQLRESERLRSELISVISHEVRTPLACVLGYTSLLQTRPVDEATRQEYLSIIADEARRLEGLVGDLVDVKRIEQGRLELEPQPFDLGALVEGAGARLRRP